MTETSPVLERMTRSAANYWFGFMSDGVVSTALVIAGFNGARGSILAGAGLLLAGYTICSFYRYAFHRWWFHSPNPSSAVALHASHHERPRALIGVPFFISLVVCGFTWVLGWLVVGPALGAVFAGGMLQAQTFEGALHHALHHHRFASSRWLGPMQRRHAEHHRRNDRNFGISSAVWDRLLGTEL